MLGEKGIPIFSLNFSSLEIKFCGLEKALNRIKFRVRGSLKKNKEREVSIFRVILVRKIIVTRITLKIVKFTTLEITNEVIYMKIWPIFGVVIVFLMIAGGYYDYQSTVEGDIDLVSAVYLSSTDHQKLDFSTKTGSIVVKEMELVKNDPGPIRFNITLSPKEPEITVRLLSEGKEFKQGEWLDVQHGIIPLELRIEVGHAKGGSVNYKIKVSVETPLS